MKTLEKQLFFETLHKAREVDTLIPRFRMFFIAGYLKALQEHKEDLQIAQNIKNYWINKADGVD